MTNKDFLGLLEQYYGRMPALHKQVLAEWLRERGFSSHYLIALSKEIMGTYSTKYGKPADLATVQEAHKRIVGSYVPPAETIDRNQKLIGERYVDHEEALEKITAIISGLSRKKRVKA